jgi:hypothetical protein
VEIKCQLDATDDFLLQILLLAQHVSGTIMPIIRNSRVLYRRLLPVVFGALVFKLSVWCGAEGCVSGLRAAAAGHITTFYFHILTTMHGQNHFKIHLFDVSINFMSFFVLIKVSWVEADFRKLEEITL